MIKVTATAPARCRGSEFPRKKKNKSRFIDDEVSFESELDLYNDLVDEEHAINANQRVDDTFGTASDSEVEW